MLVSWLNRFGYCPVCGIKPRASWVFGDATWVFGDATGRGFWRMFEGEQVCHTCAYWADQMVSEPVRRSALCS